MQLRPLSRTARRDSGARPPPPWVRVRSSAVGLAGEFLPSRHTLGQIVLQGEAIISGELSVHLGSQGLLLVPLMAGATAAEVALELASRILTETPFDADVRSRGQAFSVALGVRAEVV